MGFRIGQGFDLHRLVEGRDLLLGGVKIPFSKGLLGHSDADVLSHAITDAVLGALALGDIGTHFPDTDEKFKGADSIHLLKEVLKLMQEEGYYIVNIDCTIQAQEPKLMPHVLSIRESLSKAMGLDLGQISIKAKTYEKLGEIGSGEAIAVYCNCLLNSDN